LRSIFGRRPRDVSAFITDAMTTGDTARRCGLRYYLHLAGVVFRDEASALERRLLGVQDRGTNKPEAALESQEV
jgi:hypothetical protein